MTDNPRTIEWPQDAAGFLPGFKDAGVRAVERIQGNPQKYEDFMRTVKVLADYAKARYARQRVERQQEVVDILGFDPEDKNVATKKEATKNA